MKNTKILAMACLTAMMVSVFSGCQKKGSEQGTDGIVKLKWWTNLYSHIAQTATNFGEVEFYKELSERTGVEFEFIHPTVGQEDEQFNIMISSGDLPDLIERDFTKYKGGPQKAIDEKIIIGLDSYIDNNAPNYKKILSEHPNWDKQVKTDDGKHYVFASFRGDESLMCWFGPQIRKDLLDKAGLSLPETIEEWDNTLRKFKEMGIDYPITGSGLDMNSTFSGAFGVGEKYYVDGNTVKYGILEPGYKDYIALLAKWYKDDLLDPDFFAQDGKSLDYKITTGKVGAYMGAVGGSMGKYLPVLKEQGWTLSGTKYPVLNKGDKPGFGQKDFAYYPMTSVAITTKCKNPDAAVKFLDYGYGEEGHMLYNFGIEGISYNIENDYPKYTDLILKNPDGLSIQHAMARYMASVYCGPFVQDKRYFEQYMPYDEQKEAVSRWMEQEPDHRLPTISFNQEETELVANLSTEINAYINENLLKFITGQSGMDKYDKFTATLKTMGMDKLIDANQKALIRYKAR